MSDFTNLDGNIRATETLISILKTIKDKTTAARTFIKILNSDLYEHEFAEVFLARMPKEVFIACLFDNDREIRKKALAYIREVK